MTPFLVGSSEYMKLVADPVGAVDASSLDERGAAVSRTEAVELKPMRPPKGETEAGGKRRRGKDGQENADGGA